jgi:riboflavin kinase / FMN adenylyltransferase
MEIIRGIQNLTRILTNPVVTLGNFDGVHLGHQKIFQRVKGEASKIQGEATVITFDPHPLKVLSPQYCPPLLTSFLEKMTLIEKSGMDTVLCIEFTVAFSQTSPLEFIRDILVGRMKARKIIVGYNYHFGKNKGGDVNALRTIGGSLGVEVDVVEPLTIDDTIVSSSKIREFIREGDVEKASKLLGRDYSMSGRVIEGAQRGRILGFPTANLPVTNELYPKAGVYAVEVLWQGQSFDGLANIGVNPTFQPAQTGMKEKVSFEVYILNFEKNIYGDEIQVNFKKRIRGEIRFDSTGDLVRKIQEDVRWAEENVFTKRD